MGPVDTGVDERYGYALTGVAGVPDLGGADDARRFAERCVEYDILFDVLDVLKLFKPVSIAIGQLDSDAIDGVILAEHLCVVIGCK